MAQKQLVKRSQQSFTRLARFINQLMREQLGCGPVTVQQCYTLEALIDEACQAGKGLAGTFNQLFLSHMHLRNDYRLLLAILANSIICV